MRTSLQARLTFNFLIIILVTIGILAVATNYIITDRFNEMVFNSGQRYANRVAPFFAAFYAENDSWDGIEEIAAERLYLPIGPPTPQQFASEGMGNLDAGDRPADSLGKNQGDNGSVRNFFPVLFGSYGGGGPAEERVLLIDLQGTIVFDSNPDGDVLPAIDENMDKGIVISADDEPVGTILVASSFGILTNVQRTFLIQVNTFLIVVAVISAVLAILLGWFQAKRIVAPVKSLSGAAQKVAAGDYTQRVEAKSKDELGEMADAFNTMAEDLEEQRTLRQRAMSDIAHELRTPLSILQIDLESIEDGISQPDSENIGMLRDQVIYIGKLVNDLRMLALADAGELTIEMEPLDLSSLIDAITHRVESSFNEKHLSLNVDIPEKDLLVNGDEQRLSQVLLNLLENARQHTPQNGEVSIRSIRLGDEVQTTIKDNGEGIPESDLPHVFDRLYRSSVSRSRNNGGTGLGLSIARSLIEAHGGRIWIQSKEGEGTMITFALSLAKL